MITTLILPGIGNSGPDHWQSQWQKLHPAFQRVEQNEWDAPRCSDWVKRLDEVISKNANEIVLVSHSSSCALVAHWRAQASSANIGKIRGALLVAPSDPTGPHYPVGPTGFAPVPLISLPFPSIVVASRNDQYVSIEQASIYATAWGSRIVIVENAGHINSSSGLGDWPVGFALLQELQG